MIQVVVFKEGLFKVQPEQQHEELQVFAREIKSV